MAHAEKPGHCFCDPTSESHQRRLRAGRATRPSAQGDPLLLLWPPDPGRVAQASTCREVKRRPESSQNVAPSAPEQAVHPRLSRRRKWHPRARAASVKLSFMENLCDRQITPGRCRARPGAQPSRKVLISPSERCRGSFETCGFCKRSTTVADSVLKSHRSPGSSATRDSHRLLKGSRRLLPVASRLHQAQRVKKKLAFTLALHCRPSAKCTETKEACWTT